MHYLCFCSTPSRNPRFLNEGALCFVGHLAVAFVAKRIEPKVSLGTYVLAALLADFVVFLLMILGVEYFRVEPGVLTNRIVGSNIAYSHSLVMDVIWGAVFAVVYFLVRRNNRGAWILFGVVLSHWVLDFISHRPDMPLAPGPTSVFGLGLWNSFAATLIVEGGFWLVSILVYLRATESRSRTGVYAFWIGVAILTFLWYGNLKGGMDPNPVKAGVGGLVLFSLVTLWAYWMNRIRPART